MIRLAVTAGRRGGNKCDDSSGDGPDLSQADVNSGDRKPPTVTLFRCGGPLRTEHPSLAS